MKKHFKFIALGLAIMLLVIGTVLVNHNKVSVTNAADYSYTEGVDGISTDENGNLVVDFTVTYGTDGTLHNWIIYFFSEETSANFDYGSDHKYYQSAGMDRDTAEYYFVTDNNSYTGHVRAVLSPDAHAYSNKGLHGDPASVTDYLDYDTGLTLADVADLDNWYVSAGPLWSSTWSSTGLAYNVDVYLGRGNELPSFRSTVYFRDFDGTVLDSKDYTDKNVNVDISDVEFTADTNKVWTGWYCDANKQTYNNLDDIHALTVSNLMSNTRTVNFYATYQRGNGEYIEFTPVANYTGNYTQDSENDTFLLEKTDDDTTFTVTYKITHNDGVNSILLLPEFDTSVFSIVGVTIDETTALGTATFTNGGFDKILLESNTVYSGLNNTFMTITFNIDSPKDGDYTFGLKLYPYVHNDVSEAYYYDTENNGEQNEMAIVVVDTNSVVRVLTMKDAKIEIGKNSYDEYEFVYNGMTHDIERIEFDADFNTTTTTVVEYKYNGTASTEDIVAKWYTGSWEYDYELDEEIFTYTERSAPVYAGYYYVGISAPAHGIYHAVPTVYREVYIEAMHVYVRPDAKSSAYGDDIVPLTYTIEYGSVVQGDSLGITLSTTATSSSNVGDYTISGDYDSVANDGKYYVTIFEGTYTITKKSITIKALDQSAGYTGSEPTVDQTMYTVEGATISEGVVITKAPGANVGQYTLTPSYTNANYNVSTVPGVFHITSVGLDAEYIFSFFSGDTVTFDAISHDLLIVDNNIPNWISYSPSNNNQTNANTYTIAINVTISAQDAANYTSGTTAFNSTVIGKINPRAMTVTAENKTSAYGTTPATLTPTKVGLNNEVDVSFAVEDNGTPITLTSTTPVGSYDIVPSATNTNYSFTFVNGVYTVTIGQATITSVTAQDVYYNRPLNYVVSGVSIPGIANPVEGTDYTITVTLDTNEEHGEVVNGVRPYGTYTVTVTVAGTSAYNGATESATFHINQIALKAPTNVTYTAYNTVTWDEITTDEGDVALVEETTVIYSRGVNNEYIATYPAGMLTIYFHAGNNNNYTSATLELKPTIEVTFIDDHSDHAKDDIDPENMPSSFYAFVGAYVPGIELPDTIPTLPGYTFNEWSLYSEEVIEEDVEDRRFTRVYITTWSIKTLTMTLKFTETSADLGEDMFIVEEVEYKEAIAWTNIPQPTKASTNPGITYVYNNTVKVSGTETTYTGTYNTGSLALQGIVATANTTFVALYDEVYNSFTITYYVSVDGDDYAEVSEYEDNVVYGTAIDYDVLSNIVWFNVDSWYADTDRTIVAPVTMPAHDLTVYGSYVFDIGTGDINADGSVDANDITLYRQWIVGGYEMTVLTTNAEILETANAETTNATQTRYFLTRVADNNGDNSKDIRDISITRMSIVGGYTWDNENGYNVTGHEIIRNVHSNILNTLDTAIRAGKKVTLTGDVTEQNAVININTDKNVYIDLAGHTLTLESFSVVGTRKNTIKILNGTIVTEEGITISAPHGNVVLTDLAGYDKNGSVNLAAANHSLHLNGVVEFYEGTDTNVEEPTPAAVNVEKGTHIVVEPEAEVIVEKIVVTEDFNATVAETAVITLENYSVVTEEIVIEGNVVINENEISTLEELITAVEKGGSYVLVADINSESDIIVTKSLTLDLNEYSITFAEWGFEVRNNATLTFKGNGNVTAAEAPLYAQRGGNLVVNGGTFTSTANFVIGTHGSEGRGNNTITINGGIFNGSMTADGVSHGYIACGIYVANNDTVVVNGGTFNITNGCGILARSGNTTVNNGAIFNVTGNGTLGKVGDSNVTVPTGEAIVLDLKAAYPGGVPTINNNTAENVYVVVDGTYTFANDDNSFHAARGVYDNVILTADLNDYLYVNRDMNLYLNGHTVDASATSYVAIYVTDGAKLTINGNGNVISTEGCVLALNGSEFVINGGTYTCYDNFVFGTNGSEGKGNNKITINNGTFNGEIKSSGYIACGIYVANNDTVVVNGGTFNIINGCGILARSGNTTIGSNVTFNVTGNGERGKVGDSNVTLPSGEALVLDELANYPGGQPSITNNSSYSVYTINND